MLKEGTKAPDILLPDKNGDMIRLSDFGGSKVVLYFYPKDSTSGCTKQAVGYAAKADIFERNGIKVIGVSKDSQASHIRFADKYSLPFTLLSDTGLDAIKAYDVWQEKKMAGKTGMGVVRTTYIIDESGYIEKNMGKVNAAEDARNVLRYLGLE